MLGKLKKLDVGDMSAFEKYCKDKRREELIAITRGLYGNNIPEGEVSRIEREIQTTENIDNKKEATLDEMQFLIFRSLLKSNPEASLEDVGSDLTVEKLVSMVNEIMPPEEGLPGSMKKKKSKKKAVRKKKPKDN